MTDWTEHEGAIETGPGASPFGAADRSWCVATEIDVDSTLVGATRELVDTILHDDELAAIEVGPTTDLSAFGDRLDGS